MAVDRAAAPAGGLFAGSPFLRQAAEFEAGRPFIRSEDIASGDTQAVTEFAHRNDQAVELLNTGRAAAAATTWELLQADCERLLGPDHPDTLMVIGNRACAVAMTGAPEAARLLEESLAARNRVFGGEHPATLNALDAAAAIHRRNGRLDQAVAYSTMAVDLRTRVRGATHLETIVSRLGLAQAYADAGEVHAAHSLLDAVLHDALSTVGPRSVVTAEIRATMGSLYGAAGQADRARMEMGEALAVIEGQLGRSHPDTVALRGELDALVG
jgi:hypothetical protein